LGLKPKAKARQTVLKKCSHIEKRGDMSEILMKLSNM
jgi:hypothetical protein